MKIKKWMFGSKILKAVAIVVASSVFILVFVPAKANALNIPYDRTFPPLPSVVNGKNNYVIVYTPSDPYTGKSDAYFLFMSDNDVPIYLGNSAFPTMSTYTLHMDNAYPEVYLYNPFTNTWSFDRSFGFTNLNILYYDGLGAKRQILYSKSNIPDYVHGGMLFYANDISAFEEHVVANYGHLAPTEPGVVSSPSPGTTLHKASTYTVSWGSSTDYRGFPIQYRVQAEYTKSNGQITPEEMVGSGISSASTNYTIENNSDYNYVRFLVDAKNTDNDLYSPVQISDWYPLSAPVDTTPPTLSLSESPSSWTNGNVTINASGSDSGSGMGQIELPNGTWVNGASASYTVTSNGTYTFWAKDNLGNTSSQSITVNNIDNSAPSAPTISSSGLDGAWNGQDVTETITDNGDTGSSGVNRIEYSLSGATSQGWATYGSPVKIASEGTTTISARVVDNAGNVSPVTSKTVQVDTMPPSLSVTGDPQDLTNAVTMTADATDAGSGVKRIETPDGNWVNGSHVTYEVAHDGTYTFTAEDNYGHESSESYQVSNIKENILITNKREVLLNLHAEDKYSGVADMQFRNEYGSWSAWQPYSEQADWTLASGDGLKHVWAEYEDAVGNVSTPVEDVIILDTTPPAISSFSINNGDKYTNNKDVTLSINSADTLTGIKDMYLSNDGTNWTQMPYSTSANWTLSDGDGNKTVYLKTEDVAGNVSGVQTASIFLDTVKPQASIQINGGSQFTASRDVTLTLNYADPGGSGIADVKVFEGDKEYDLPHPIPNAPIAIPWTLDFGTVRTVSIQTVDNAGNVSDVASATIIVDKLTMQGFNLDNVVNPYVFYGDSPFVPLTWAFKPQPMLAGANITFSEDLKASTDPSAVVDGIGYKVDVIGDNNYHQVFTGVMNKNDNHYSETITLPKDAPNGSKVYVSTVATRKLLVAPYDTQTVYFPGADSSEEAQIGVVSGNIDSIIHFNEIN